MNSMLGALVGDAAGATLEFCDDVITQEMALNAMKMPGGGALHVGPGQITDDGELTLTLWNALKETKHVVPILTLMKRYSNWYDSIPFDMGRTCSLAFETYNDYFDGCGHMDSIQDCKRIVNGLNAGSEANGALMRATAIPTWVIQNSLDVSIGVECAKEDARLSHPSLVCQECNTVYVFAIIQLLRGISPDAALELTNEFVKENITSEKVKEWYFKESFDITGLDATKQIGHVRWGFVMSMYFLRHPEIGYEEAIKITLMKGGDTDTNAAIVGGIVGAYHEIPEYMKRPVLEFDCTLEGKHHIRPIEYSVKEVIGHLIE